MIFIPKRRTNVNCDISLDSQLKLGFTKSKTKTFNHLKT